MRKISILALIFATVFTLLPPSMFGQTIEILEHQLLSGDIITNQSSLVLNSFTGNALEYSITDGFEELPVFDYDTVFKDGEFTYGIDISGYLDIYDANYQLIKSYPIDVNGHKPAVLPAKNLGSTFIVSRGTGETKSYLLQNQNLYQNTTTPGDGQMAVRSALIYNGEEGTSSETVLIILKTDRVIVRNYSQNGSSFVKHGGAGCVSVINNKVYMNHGGSYKQMDLLSGEMETIFSNRTAITTMAFNNNLIIGKGLFQIQGDWHGGFIIDEEGNVSGTDEFGIESPFDWLPTDNAAGASTNVAKIPGTENQYLIQLGSLNGSNVGNMTKKVEVILDSDQVVSVQDVEQNLLALEIFPNPTVDLINFDLPSEIKVDQITIYNMFGQIAIDNIEVTARTIDVSHLTPGAYTLQILTEEGPSVSQLIKN